MVILRLISIFILFFLFSIISLHAQTAQEYYMHGLELKKQNQIDEAIESLKKAVEKDRKFVDAYYELALAYQLKKTPAALKRAEEAIMAAKKYGDDDVKYLSALAYIYEDMYFYPVAKSTWGRVLKIDPENTEALAGFARHYANKVDRYGIRLDPGEREKGPFFDINMLYYQRKYDTNLMYYTKEELYNLASSYKLSFYKIVEGGSDGLIRWDDFVAVYDSLSRSYNDKILAINPDDRDALYRKGLLYFDRIKFISRFENENFIGGFIPDTQYFDEFAQLFKELVEKHPDDKDGHLFLGLAHQRMYDYDKAYEHFKIAKSLMSDEERAVFSNVGYLKVGGFDETEIQSTENDTSKFWYQRDPLYLTPYNEREMEHYGRFAEANLRFSVPRSDIEGWRTEQGKILIKYGPPKIKSKFIDNYMPPFRIAIRASALDFYNMKNEFWYYDDFSFAFETGYADEEDKYKLASLYGINFLEILKNDIEPEFPEYYEYEPKGLFIDFPFDVATFRGEEGRTRIELYYGVPFNKVRFEEEGNYYYGNYQTGVFLHDWDWNMILEDVQYKDLQFAVAEIDTSSDDIAVDRFIYQVEPDSYHFAIEMKDMYSDNVGTYRDTLKVEEYGYGSLKISDIQLASYITLLDSTGAVTRDNLDITPNPPRFYRANQPIYIYYEIYNLFLDAFPGNTDYTVEYSIQYIGEDKYSIVDYVRSLIVNEKQELGVTTKFSRRGIDRDESSFLRIDHSLTKEGPYQLTLKVTDNIAHKSVEKSVVLSLFENK